ncbi:MAG: DUF4329 domain-containing protein [Armatimonadota bacterium]|nr:DUF4329 domain-containing protein [Armatimonadota bacterium]
MLTGGPGGDKSTLMRELREADPHARHWLLVPEAAPLLFQAGLAGQVPVGAGCADRLACVQPRKIGNIPYRSSMPEQLTTVLSDSAVRAALQRAWRDSQPGVSGGHEEGGFILRDAAGNLSVARWPQGGQATIGLPPHPNCKVGESDVVATFHTHPNTGSDFLQEPSETDKRAVRDDPDLKGIFYEGELVIAHETIYLVMPDGHVREVGNRRAVLGEASPA